VLTFVALRGCCQLIDRLQRHRKNTMDSAIEIDVMLHPLDLAIRLAVSNRHISKLLTKVQMYTSVLKVWNHLHQIWH
jgi:phage tail tube protein FII